VAALVESLGGCAALRELSLADNELSQDGGRAARLALAHVGSFSL
jgi:hypothetical protein